MSWDASRLCRSQLKLVRCIVSVSGGGSEGPHLVDVVAELALCDGPGLLVVPLEGSYLGAYNRCVTIPIVVHAPVVHPRQEICRNSVARCTILMSFHAYDTNSQVQRRLLSCIEAGQGSFSPYLRCSKLQALLRLIRQRLANCGPLISLSQAVPRTGQSPRTPMLCALLWSAEPLLGQLCALS